MNLAPLAADVLVIGGGPAGLATAIEVTRRGRRAIVAERSASRRRRLCGEFLSGDGCRVLEQLGAPLQSDCPDIDAVRLSSRSGRSWTADIPGLGRGCSRSRLVESMQRRAAGLGVTVLTGARVDSPPGLPVEVRQGGQLRAVAVSLVVAASGHGGAARWGTEPSSRRGWLAVAVHAAGSAPGRVELHATSRGYVGANPVEGGRVNLCGLFRLPDAPGEPLDLLMQEAMGNPLLDNILNDLSIDPSSVAVVAGLDFRRRRLPAGILAVGDAAGAPVPMLGQGLAAALRGGQLLGELAVEALNDGRGQGDATAALATRYRGRWQAEFGRRFACGRWLHHALLQPVVHDAALRALSWAPAVGRALVRTTRGPLAGA